MTASDSTSSYNFKVPVTRKNLTYKTLESISVFIGKHPYYILIFSLLLALLSIQFTIDNLKFLTNRNDLISPHAKYYQDYKKFRDEFKDFDGLVIAVEGENKQRVINFVEDLAAFFNSDPENFEDIFYKLDIDFFKNKKLLFLTPDELQNLENKIKSNRSFIQNLIEKPGLVSFFDGVNKEISEAMVGSLVTNFLGGKEEKSKKISKESLDLSLVESVLEQTVNSLKGADAMSSPWNDLFIKKSGEIDEDGYLTSNKKMFYYVFVSPVENKAELAKAVGPIRVARNYIKKLEDKYPGVTAGVTGPTALASDEMITTSDDMVKASLISLIGVSLLLILSLKKFTLPIIAVFTLVVSLCWSFGFTTLIIGHLNILSIVFTTVLIGLGIDFGIHYITRFQEELEIGNNVPESMANSLVGTGKGLIAGAVTTALAFMTTVFADFKGIAELGIIAGTGIIICLIATMTLLPAMILILEHLKIFSWIKKSSEVFAFDYNLSHKSVHPFFDILLKKPDRLILLASIITFLSIFAAKDISFDYNILNLQASDLESVQYEMKILDNSDKSAWYGAVIVDTFDEVLATKKRLELLPSVNIVSSIASILPDRQEEKITAIKQISSFFNKFPSANKKSPPVNLNKLSNVLKKIHFKLRDENNNKWEDGRKPQSESIKKIRQLISDYDLLIQQQETTAAEASLNNYQVLLFTDFKKKLTSFKEALHPKKMELSDIPESLKERFIGKTGKFLLQIYPKMNIYDREPMEEFISDIWSVDHNATGTAVTASESSRLMKEGYIRGGIYALIAIVLFVLISFRDWLCTLLVILPLLLGILWTLGLMVLFDLQFNLANLVILPLIIGIGVDNGIHIVHRYRDDVGSAISPIYKSTGRAVILSSLTTMIGFGSLMVASHRGIYSLGALLTIGVGCCMIASLTVLPAILKITREKGWNPKKM